MKFNFSYQEKILHCSNFIYHYTKSIFRFKKACDLIRAAAGERINSVRNKAPS